jgi:hypothetical protein
MRPVLRLLFGASILVGALLARDSHAGATVDLLFVGRNGGAIAPTDSVFALPGDTLTMVVLLHNDEALTAAWFSLNYDVDGDDELDVVSAFQWRGLAIHKSGTDFFAPGFSTVEPFRSTATFVGSFQGITRNFWGPRTLPPSGGAFAGGYQMGTVVWKVNPGVNDDGADVVSGLFNFGYDFFRGAEFGDVGVDFNPATVIPEPGTASLLGLGIVGLVLLWRGRRLGARSRR